MRHIRRDGLPSFAESRPGGIALPSAALRPCAGGCGARVASGRCSTCSRHIEQTRGSAHARGYSAGWGKFRIRFMADLIQAGIPVVCGASLPDGPPTHTFSLCVANGLSNGFDLELDHEPPLTQAEREAAARGDRRAFDDPKRVGFLCSTCHKAKGDGTFRRELVHAAAARSPYIADDRPAYDFISEERSGRSRTGDRPHGGCRLRVCAACERGHHGGAAPQVKATVSGSCGCVCHVWTYAKADA